jgi:hypothetical protein
MLKKINLILEEDLSYSSAVLFLNEGKSKKITPRPKNDFLGSLLNFKDVKEYSIQGCADTKPPICKKKTGLILKILVQDKSPSKSFKPSVANKEIICHVILDENYIGKYTLTSNLIDVHHIEHFFGIFKCLGVETDFFIKD